MPTPNPVREVLNPPVLKKSDVVLSIVVLIERSVFLKLGLMTENLPFTSSSESEKFVESLIPFPR